MKNLFYLTVTALMLLSSCQQSQSQQPAQSSTQEVKNATVETILSRRSIRSYKPEQINEQQLDTIINCAINAPSANNKQPWEVRVVQNPELMKEIVDGYKAFSKNDRSPFYNAPTLIVVAYQKDNRYGQLDCGWLGQNILLAAESMNIGTCVVGGPVKYFNSPEAKSVVDKLKFSEGYEILYTITMGYKNESPDAKPRDKNRVQVIK